MENGGRIRKALICWTQPLPLIRSLLHLHVLRDGTVKLGGVGVGVGVDPMAKSSGDLKS